MNPFMAWDRGGCANLPWFDGQRRKTGQRGAVRKPGRRMQPRLLAARFVPRKYMMELRHIGQQGMHYSLNMVENLLNIVY